MDSSREVDDNMKRRAQFLAVAVVAGLALSARAHEEEGPRSPNLRAENVVQVSSTAITVHQKQVFQGEFVKNLWDMLDADKDGTFSKAEKAVFAEKFKPFYATHAGLRVNWRNLPLKSVDVAVDGFPKKRPKDDKGLQPITAGFTAVYDYKPTPLDLVELYMPNLNAHEAVCAFSLDKGFRALRASQGRVISNQSVEGMVQVDGKPDLFSLILIKE